VPPEPADDAGREEDEGEEVNMSSSNEDNNEAPDVELDPAEAVVADDSLGLLRITTSNTCPTAVIILANRAAAIT
jgi:hypothetical protein